MKKFIIWVLVFPVKIYQKLISPLLPPNCIYTPSCSSYFIKSLQVHGPIKGFIIGVLRILRCSPFFKGGWDPVESETTITKELKKYRFFNKKESR